MGFRIPAPQLDEACVYHGGRLTIPFGLNSICVLQALADVESTYGKNAIPRYEPAYGWGGRYANRTLLKEWGAWAACSYGPFQVMFPTLQELGVHCTPMEAAADPQVTCLGAVRFIEQRVIKHFPGDCKVEDALRIIADAYNSGNPRDRIVPAEYIEKFQRAYAARLTARRQH